VRDAEIEPGFYVVCFVRKGMAPQQATFLVTREAHDAELILTLPLDAKDENMALITAGDVKDSNGAMQRVPAFAIDRYEYPNKPGTEPETGLSLLEARKLCEQQGKKLCTPFQWLRPAPETAGASPRQRLCQRRVCDRLRRQRANSAAAQRPLHALPHTGGVYDMAGNTAEWVDSASEILLGGDWTGSVKTPDLSGSCRTVSSAEDINKDRRGFRCCKAANK